MQWGARSEETQLQGVDFHSRTMNKPPFKGEFKAVNRMSKGYKRSYLKSLAAETEEAAYHGNMRNLYATIKNLSGKCTSKRDRWVINMWSRGAHEEMDVAFWGAPQATPHPFPRPSGHTACRQRIILWRYSALTKEETQNAIKQLRNGKAAGPDNIPAEALKVDIRTNVELLYPLFIKIWIEERVPTEWKEGYLINLLKKGDLISCSNYRSITLLSIPGKVINRVLLNRMKDAIDP